MVTLSPPSTKHACARGRSTLALTVCGPLERSRALLSRLDYLALRLTIGPGAWIPSPACPNRGERRKASMCAAYAPSGSQIVSSSKPHPRLTALVQCISAHDYTARTLLQAAPTTEETPAHETAYDCRAPPRSLPCKGREGLQQRNGATVGWW